MHNIHKNAKSFESPSTKLTVKQAAGLAVNAAAAVAVQLSCWTVVTNVCQGDLPQCFTPSLRQLATAVVRAVTTLAGNCIL
jgi:hypothetical protein